jgi:alpha-tubulin suppressor-like RCC1 family protein
VRSWIAVASTNGYTVAIADGGVLWAWGTSAALGLDGGAPRSIGCCFSAIAVGDSHVLALSVDAGLWTWGGNFYGQLGLGTTSDSSALTQLTGAYRAVAANRDHSFAITSNNDLMAWGDNTNSVLGLGSAAHLSPALVHGQVASVSTALNHTVELKLNGSVWAWGSNYYGQNGTGSSTTFPLQVPIDAGVLSVVTGMNYTLFLLSNGSLRGVGTGVSAHFNSTVDAGDSMALIPVAAGKFFRSVSAGSTHVLAIDLDGGLWGWGENSSHELGIVASSTVTTPQLIGTGYVAAVAPDYPGIWSLALKADGTLWGWGSNGSAQLALPSTVVSVPTQLP